ncbi:hypothetical protein JKP88DRAFT_279006 [Tribonema minus]|uniref:Uncharacterized protein n=1 Tax=Tribonema minus TaxID=303371 RepID=A0A836CCC0_9STRA|nr:hypothetical protein JKP88DRAFT_279006 [Tribonema minus]
MASSSEAVERARPNAPTAPANRQDIMSRVLTSMAGHRLLPKEGWSLNRAIHDTVAPTVNAHLVAGRATPAIAHRLLENTSRRHVTEEDCDDSVHFEQPLPSLLESFKLLTFDNTVNACDGMLPAGLRVLELVGRHHRWLDEVPPGLRVLKLRAHQHPLPQLPDTLHTALQGLRLGCEFKQSLKLDFRKFKGRYRECCRKVKARAGGFGNFGESQAPTAPANHHEIMRRVFTSMAGRRLLPKESWSLNRAIHDTAAPTVEVHLVAGSASPAIAHCLLEGIVRRLIVNLTMEGDFTKIQAHPLSLPPSLVRLSLRGFRVHWQDLIALLSPAVANVEVHSCLFASDIRSHAVTILSLPEGLSSLQMAACNTVSSGRVIFSRAPTPELADLPPGLRVLKLRAYEHPLPPLPHTLETLPAPPLPDDWPAHLEHLVYWATAASDSEDRAWVDHLPLTLTRLELNGCAVLDGAVPQTLQELRLGRELRHAFDLDVKKFTGTIKINSNRSDWD